VDLNGGSTDGTRPATRENVNTDLLTFIEDHAATRAV
jgi:hypothetical protein